MRALYRIHDAAGRLLYVGQSDTPVKRIDRHLETQPWRTEVAYVSITWHGDADIDEDERRAIFTERPLYNTEHANPLPIPEQRFPYDADRERTRTAVLSALAVAGSPIDLYAIIEATGRSKFAVLAALAEHRRSGTVDMDEGTGARLYRLVELSLAQERRRDRELAILDAVLDNPGISRRGILEAVGDTARNRAAVEELVKAHVIRVEAGPNHSHRHYANRGSTVSPAEPFAPWALDRVPTVGTVG